MKVDSVETLDGRLVVLWDQGAELHRSEYSAAAIGDLRDYLVLSREPEPFSPAELPVIEWTGSASKLEEARQTLMTSAAVLIRGLPSERGVATSLAEAFGGVRLTEFGSCWDIQSSGEPGDLGFEDLLVHTDSPYRDPRPGFQVLHCVRPARLGGETIIVDGVAAAATLDAGQVCVLAETPVEFRYRRRMLNLSTSAPILETGIRGRPEAIRFNRRSMVGPIGSPERLAAWYEAFLTLTALVDDSANQTRIRLNSGEAVILNNHRMLHGRTAFDAANQQRLLQGAYGDLDSVRLASARHQESLRGIGDFVG